MDITEGIEDPTVLTALGDVLNKEHVDEKIDLVDLERQFIGNISPEVRQVDPAEAFKEAMSSMMEGIEEPPADFGAVMTDASTSTSRVSTSFGTSTPAPAPAPAPVGMGSDPVYVDRSVYEAQQQSSFSPSSADISMSRTPSYHPRTDYKYNLRPDRSYKTDLEKMTEEQQRQSRIDQVLKNMDGGMEFDESGFEKEREEEHKAILLEDIDSLRTEMTDERIDISRIPEVDASSNMVEIENVHRMLKYKYDRQRYGELARDAILTGVYALEYVFDGKRQWGPYRPDLTDWHNTVKVKLRHMKYETSTIVSDIMKEYNIGPMWRIALELIPSAIIHSRIRSGRTAADVYTADEYADAIDHIRDYDD